MPTLPIKLNASQTAQRLVDMRGYIVVPSIHPRKVGDVIDDLAVTANAATDPLVCKTVVIGITDKADYLAQLLCLGIEPQPGDYRNLPYYYRLRAE